MGLNRSSFNVKVPEYKNLEHEQNVETSCALSKNHSKQKGFQAVRCQQVYYQKQNSQRCRQTVWATAWADRKFWFTGRHFRNCVGAHVAILGKFSGVPADHTYDLSFAVRRGLPPLMAYFQVAGALDSSIVFWVRNIQIVRCPRDAPPTCGIALVLSCCLW